MVRSESHFRTPQAVGYQLEHIVIVSQASSGSRHPEVSILRQDNVFCPDAHLEVLFIVGHSVVKQNGQGVLEILNLGPHLAECKY